MTWRAMSAWFYCGAAVLASDLPCAGTRVGMRRLNLVDSARLARAVRAFTPYMSKSPFGFRRDYSPLESLGRIGYVESSDLPRAGRVVRLELEEFFTSAERLAWAKEKGCRWDAWTCARAARGGATPSVWDVDLATGVHTAGHLGALLWLRAHGCPWDTMTCEAAAMGGHLMVLRWAREHGCPWIERTCVVEAARHGHLPVLRWLLEVTWSWIHTSTCEAGAMGGHVEVLKWAREQGCPWDEMTCERAVRGGHLDVLRWARAHDCPWNPQVCRRAAGGNQDMLALIQQLGG
jgi:hypothetical protein